MTSRRPVNRVTSKRRPVAGQAARPTPPRHERPVRKPRVANAGRVTGRGASVAQSPSATRKRRESMARPTPSGAAAASVGSRPLRSGRGLWFLVGGFVIAAALLGGFAVVAADRPGVDTSNHAFVDNEATQEVRAAAEHALRTVYAYDVKHIDGYRDAAKQVLTGKMLTDLDKYADTTISAVKQAQTSADAKADPIAVTLLTDDRAELLVNLVVSATKDGVAQQSVAGPVVLHMQKVDGRWLASDIVDQ